MKITLLGFGGHAGNLIDICQLRNYEIAGFIDDAANGQALPRLDAIEGSAVLGFGALSPEKLEDRYNTMLYSPAHFVTLTHPDAIISHCAMFGDGVQVMAGAIIQHNAQVDSGCIINTGAIIEHGSIIHKGCHIAPGAKVLGNCEIGAFSFIGAGAIIVQGSKLPPRSFIKAGSIWRS